MTEAGRIAALEERLAALELEVRAAAAFAGFTAALKAAAEEAVSAYRRPASHGDLCGAMQTLAATVAPLAAWPNPKETP